MVVRRCVPAAFPEEALEHVLNFLRSNKDRNAVSLVCKSWYKIESGNRESVFIGNCYAVSPEILVSRFPRVKAVTLKGKPHFADFNLLPTGWGADVGKWIISLAENCPWLEELHLKRMVLSDDALHLLSRSFPNFKVLVLKSCEGFSTHGLASVAANCRHLTVLDLRECDVDDRGGGHWLTRFPETSTSLSTLNFSCVNCDVNIESLERLIARSPNLKCLKVNRWVLLENHPRLLAKAPQLVDLGASAYRQRNFPDDLSSLQAALKNCKQLAHFSGFLDITPGIFSALQSVCHNVTVLNLSYTTTQNSDLVVDLITSCPKLQRLLVLDYIGDQGLELIASKCKDLEELRVFPMDPAGPGAVTEKGLVAISKGCTKLISVLYFCLQMTNEALITIAKTSPQLTRFRLCIITVRKPDPVTERPLDEGFGAIVQYCKSLKRLSVSGLLTDRAFQLFGKYGKKLEMISVAFAGNSCKGMQCLLQGCTSLKKLEIRDSAFGDMALLSGANKYESMRSLWMSHCPVTPHSCKELASKMPRLNVEVIEESYPPEGFVEKLYVYRSLIGPRDDMPEFIHTM